MSSLRMLLARLLSSFRRDRGESELDDELRFHLQMEIDRHLARGLPPDAAQRAARRSLGGVDVTRQRYRDQKGLPMLDTLRQDVRYSVRLLAKDRVFTLVAVATLALGIGANTAIFSVVHGVLLDPLPYPDADRIVTVWEDFSAQGGPEQEWIEVPNFFEWRTQTDLFDTLSAYTFGSVNLTGHGEAQRLSQGRVSHDFLDTFGAAPAIGRGFTPADDRPGVAPTAILAHGFWQRAFGSDPSVVGRTLQLDGMPAMVIGVLPEGTGDAIAGQVAGVPPVDVWMPLRIDATSSGRGNFFLRGIGRLAEGVTVDRAASRLDAMMARIGEQFPSNAGVTIRIVPLLDQIVSPVRTGLYVLLGIVTLVLLIACGNIASLMLSRGASRAREMAIRSAVGAWRGRLVRQLLTESVVLSLVGGGAGVALALWATRVLLSRVPPGTAPRLENVGMDTTVLGFTLLVAVVAGLAFGLAPVLQARRHDVVSALKDGGRGAQEAGLGSRARNALVVGQVALALCLLVAAGLSVRSMVALMHQDPGFRPDGLTAAFLTVPADSAAGAPELVAFMDALLARVAGHEAVDGVAAVSVLPFSGNDTDTSFRIDGRPDLDEPGREPSAWYRRVTPSYFETMGLPVLEGREFTAEDLAGAAPVVMVSDIAAERYWPGESAVGKHIGFAADGPWSTVVGVVGRVRHRGLAAEPRPELYLPFAQRPGRAMTLVVRSDAGEAAVADMLRADLRAIDPDLPVSQVASMPALVQASIAQPRFFATLTAGFGVLALVLASVGLYGVMAYNVSRRTTELGLRMALGAGRTAVLSMIVGRGLRLVAIGLAAGLIVAYWATAVMTELLFDVEPTDLGAFSGAVAVLTAVALVASLVPALRATRIDPVVALRTE